MKKYLLYIVIFLIGAFAGMWAHRQYHFRDITEMVTQTDTIVVRDTHIIEKPVLVERTYKDPLYVAVHDTLRIRDTLYIALPKETKVYAEQEYYAVVSGYEPSLDYLEVYPKTTTVKETITIAPKKNRHNIGVGIEAGYMHSLTTPAYLEYSYIPKQWMEVYGRVEYDLPSQTPGARVGLRLGIGW